MLRLSLMSVKLRCAILAVVAVTGFSSNICGADVPASSDTVASNDGSENSSRYGVFNLLDHRSRYGQYWFVEPLVGPEMDVDREVRIDWFHGEDQHAQTDEVKTEIEYNFN